MMSIAEEVQAMRREVADIDALMAEAAEDCLCGSKTNGHRFTGGQHTNGPCARSQLRVEVNGKWKRAEWRRMELLELIETFGGEV